MKPSANEKEYFARQEAERSRQAADERQAKRLEEDRERERSLHFMKCPKCGMQLEAIAAAGVHVDKCSGCEGIWLDKGELEVIRNGEGGFMEKLLSVFRQ
jgi:uncharacterized protein